MPNWKPKRELLNKRTFIFTGVFAVIGSALLIFSFAASPPKSTLYKNDDISTAFQDTQSVITIGKGVHQDHSRAKVAAGQLAKIAKERQALLVKLAKTNPKEVASMLVPDALLGDLDPIAGGAIEKKVKLSGQIQIWHIDPTDGKDEDVILLKTSSGTFNLYTNGHLPGMKSGDKATVTAYQLNDQTLFSWAASSTSNAPATITASFIPTPLGNVNTAVLIGNFQNNATSLDVNAIKAAFNGAIGNSVDDFFHEASYGQITLTPTFFGPYSIPETLTNQNTCTGDYETQLLNLANNDVNYSQYQRIIFMPNCSGGGQAMVGMGNSTTPQGTFLQAWADVKGFSTTNQEVISHELTHTFGSWHASYFDCLPAAFISPSRFDEGCNSSEYGNQFDAVGITPGQSVVAHQDVLHKSNAGWFTAANIPTISAPGTYNYKLLPYETPTNGVLGLNIPRGNSGTAFTLEYRQPTGYDSWMVPSGQCPSCNITSGVSINFNYSTNGSGGGSDTQLLDNTPNSIKSGSYYPVTDTNDGALAAGKSFTDPEYGITITVGSADSTGANVTVTIPSNICTRQTPTITMVSSATQSSTAGGSANYVMNVKSNDSASCSPERYRFNGGYFQKPNTGHNNGLFYDFYSSASPDDFSIAPGASTNMTVTIKSTTGATAGSYSLPPGPPYFGWLDANSSEIASPISLPTLTYTITEPADSTPPTTPTNVSVQALGSTVAQVSWTGSTDNSRVAAYQVQINGAGFITTSSTSLLLTNSLTAGAVNTIAVRAMDGQQNISAYSPTTSFSMPTTSDTVAPSVPGNITASTTDRIITINWLPSWDNKGVVVYNITGLPGKNYYVPGTSTSLTVSGLMTNRQYDIYVQAIDGDGNTSGFISNAYSVYGASVYNLIAQTAKLGNNLTTPTGLVPSQGTLTGGIQLSWNPSTGPNGVAGYYVYRNGKRWATVTTNSYNDPANDLFPSGYYSYYVEAFDSAGNLSAPTPQAAVSGARSGTDATPPIITLDAPSNGASVSGVVPLSTTASDDSGTVGVQYFIDQGIPTVSINSSPFNYNWDTSKTWNGAHTIYAMAIDGNGNFTTTPIATVTVNNSTTSKPGDINGDSKIDILDLSILATNFGQCGKSLSTGDLNNDGCVNVLDLSILASNWGK